MDNSNWRPTQGVSGGPVDDPSMESGDWKAQLQADSRQRIVNKIMEILNKHLSFYGHEEQQKLKKIAMRFEEKMYTVATSQYDYLQRISLKMLTMKTSSPNSMPDPMQANSGLDPTDPGSQVMPQVNIQGQQLPIPVPSQSGQQQVMPQNMQQQQQNPNYHYLYQQQLHLLAKQKLLQNQQEILSHQQSVWAQQQRQAILSHQQSVLRQQQRQQQVQPTQQQVQPTQSNPMGQHANATNMQQNPLIGQGSFYIHNGNLSHEVGGVSGHQAPSISDMVRDNTSSEGTHSYSRDHSAPSWNALYIRDSSPMMIDSVSVQQSVGSEFGRNDFSEVSSTSIVQGEGSHYTEFVNWLHL